MCFPVLLRRVQAGSARFMSIVGLCVPNAIVYLAQVGLVLSVRGIAFMSRLGRGGQDVFSQPWKGMFSTDSAVNHDPLFGF